MTVPTNLTYLRLMVLKPCDLVKQNQNQDAEYGVGCVGGGCPASSGGGCPDPGVASGIKGEPDPNHLQLSSNYRLVTTDKAAGNLGYM